MKVTFFTNAMVMLESADTRVLCDPWVTFDDVSASGFFNFPRCTLTREDVAGLRPDFIYVTHTHPDHFDPPTLALFDPATPILVADYQHNFTARNVAALGFTDVRIVPKDGSLPLNGEDEVWMEPAAGSPEVDSVAVFRLAGLTAVNANDNVFHRDQALDLRERVGGIDIGLLPSGAHGPWPMFFENYSPEEKAELAAGRARKQKDDFCSYIEAFSPRWVVPIAGGIMACGPKVHQYKYSGISPRSEVVAYARTRLDFEPVLLSEGNSHDFATGTRNGDYMEKTFDTEGQYMDRLARHPGLFAPSGKFHIDPSERIDLTHLLRLARATQRKWQNRRGATSDIAYFIDVGEETLYRLSLADDDVSRVHEAEIDDPRYEIFRMPYELLLGLLTRHYVWSNVKTQHLTYYRKGPDMDADLQVLMNFLQV